MRRFVAPGKAVVLGEYAVLLGGPAVVAAVDRGVACEVSPSPTLRIETPDDDTFVRPALDAVQAPPALYRFFDAAPPLTHGKAGLGGSAAATVVACLAGSTMAGRPLSGNALHAVAAKVHHRIQGSGSGIDVAAAVHGGVFRWEDGRAQPLHVPELHLAYSGTSAFTGPRVQAFLRWNRTHPERATAFVAQSRVLVDRFVNAPGLVLHEAGEQIGAMCHDAGIEYWTKGLRALQQLGRAHGGGCKPSGAGGGDIAVTILPSPSHAVEWRRATDAAGLPVLPVRIAQGAHEVLPSEIRTDMDE